MTTSIHLRVTTIQFSRSMTTVSRIISSQPRYDRFDTSPYRPPPGGINADAVFQVPPAAASPAAALAIWPFSAFRHAVQATSRNLIYFITLFLICQDKRGKNQPSFFLARCARVVLRPSVSAMPRRPPKRFRACIDLSARLRLRRCCN